MDKLRFISFVRNILSSSITIKFLLYILFSVSCIIFSPYFLFFWSIFQVNYLFNSIIIIFIVIDTTYWSYFILLTTQQNKIKDTIFRINIANTINRYNRRVSTKGWEIRSKNDIDLRGKKKRIFVSVDNKFYIKHQWCLRFFFQIHAVSCTHSRIGRGNLKTNRVFEHYVPSFVLPIIYAGDHVKLKKDKKI